MTLRRLAPPPGVTVGPIVPAGVDAFYVEAGSVDVARLDPGESAPSKPPRRVRATQAAPFLPLPAGTGRALTATGAEPAVVVAIDIAPTTEGAAPAS